MLEAPLGPLRAFPITDSNHPNNTVLARDLQAYLRWRSANARHPGIPTSWPPNAENEPASVTNAYNAGADPAPRDQLGRPMWPTH